MHIESINTVQRNNSILGKRSRVIKDNNSKNNNYGQCPSFRGLKGGMIGYFAGGATITALTLLTGGIAIPFVASTFSVIGAVAGHTIEESNKNNKRR